MFKTLLLALALAVPPVASLQNPTRCDDVYWAIYAVQVASQDCVEYAILNNLHLSECVAERDRIIAALLEVPCVDAPVALAPWER